MKTLLGIISLLISMSSIAQTGGTYSFPFLDLTYNARSAGLGDDFISVKDQDINIGIANPSLLNGEMQKSISLNQALMTGGINFGMFNYATRVKDKGTLSAFVQYINYGKMQRTNVAGIEEGTFNPIEMVIGSGFGKEINERISVGGNVKLVYSQLETYTSFGTGIDLAGTYYNPDKEFLVTVLAKNAGIQFNSYVGKNNRAPLPAEFQMATSYKLKHAPFRLSLLAHHLNKWDITYNDPNAKPTIDALTGDTIPAYKAGFGEKLARHFSYQVETIVSKNIHIRTGFNYHRRKEMALTSRPGISGISFGIGLYFKKFSLDYGFSLYSRSGFNNMLSFSTNIDRWRK